MYQFNGQDDYLIGTLKRFFQSPTYHIFDAAEEVGLGIKICKICRLAQASDFGIDILTPENLNVYLEAGMMMGMEKRNLYIASQNILNKQNKSLKDVAFDLSDQLVISHKSETELLNKLEREVPPFIQNVIIGTALERERRNYWRQILKDLTIPQWKILKSLSMVSKYQGFESDFNSFTNVNESHPPTFTKTWVALENKGLLIAEQSTRRSRGIWTIDPVAEPYLHELLFEEE